MAIGLLGGSFNPAHGGHMHISRIALRRLALDRIWWLVTPGNPLKSSDALAPLAERMAGAVSIARDPRIDVTGFEAARPDAFTANTLRFLVRRYPGTRFVWLMGADNLASFHNWQNWKKIAAMSPVAVLDRPGYRYAARASRAAAVLASAYADESDATGLAFRQPPAWTLLTAPLSPVSSSKIRRARAR
ncbi:MAG: nicotinate-nucleotide adenylyltransferase [Methyloligellaceae bacterium]